MEKLVWPIIWVYNDSNQSKKSIMIYTIRENWEVLQTPLVYLKKHYVTTENNWSVVNGWDCTCWKLECKRQQQLQQKLVYDNNTKTMYDKHG